MRRAVQISSAQGHASLWRSNILPPSTASMGAKNLSLTKMKYSKKITLSFKTRPWGLKKAALMVLCYLQFHGDKDESNESKSAVIFY